MCSTCGTLRPDREDECGGCRYNARQQSEAEQEFKEKVLDHLDEYILKHLYKHGLYPREAKATMDLVPNAIKAAIPKASLEALFQGNYPEKGFGLGGTTGGGKTMAVAAIIKTAAISQTKAHKPKYPYGFSGPLKSLRWASWPDEVAWLRAHAIDPKASERVDELAGAGLLVLDDLGRERIKGSYSDDWAASQLDSVINHRYRCELPTIWTTNVTEADLVNLYGAAMLRRLTADNPLIWLPNLKVMG